MGSGSQNNWGRHEIFWYLGRFRGPVTLGVWESAKSMRKNATLAPLQTSLRQVAIFPHNADFHAPRVTTLAANAPNTKIFHVCLLAICVANYL